MDKAEKSELTLLFLDASHFVMGCDFLGYIPPYSPNLNLIERLWKFVKNELRSKYYDDFDIFCQRIDSKKKAHLMKIKTGFRNSLEKRYNFSMGLILFAKTRLQQIKAAQLRHD